MAARVFTSSPKAPPRPTLAAQWKQVQAKYPQAKVIQYDAVHGDASRAASKAAFGDAYDAQYKLENADLILSLDADFLSGIAFPGFLPLSAAYAERHRYEEGKPMNRLYVVETMPTVTGYKAEHRLALRPSEIDSFTLLLKDALSGGGTTSPSESNYAGNRYTEVRDFATALAADLKAAGSKAVVIPGPQASAMVHATAHALNAQLGAVGSTVVYTQPISSAVGEQTADLKSLVVDMNAGKVQWLVMMGVNPVYTAPADLNFAAALTNVPTTVHLGSHIDETGFNATWHINAAHYLESWSDARAYDGTISIIQPMIDPMYNGVSCHDVLQALLDPSKTGYDVVAENAKTYIKGRRLRQRLAQGPARWLG